MSRPQGPHRPLFHFGNPFRKVNPKNSQLSPKFLPLLNSFEETLSLRMRKLVPSEKRDFLSLSWMKLAMESVSQTYDDIRTLIEKLELPVSDWDEKWIDAYLDITVKLLDINVIFNSELSRLDQGNLHLRCALHSLESESPNQLTRSCSSLDGWRKQIDSKNPRFANCWTILESLVRSLDLPKVKNSAKGKVLMRAMYGVKVETVFVYSVLASVLSGSAEKLFDSNIAETYLWAQSFEDLRRSANSEIRNVSSNGRLIALNELESVDSISKKLYPLVRGEVESGNGSGALESSVAELRTRAEKFSTGIDSLTKELDGFFGIVLSSRDALLSNLRGDFGGKAVPKVFVR